MSDKTLVIVNSNLISLKAQKHYIQVLQDNELFARYSKALYADEHVDPPQRILILTVHMTQAEDEEIKSVLQNIRKEEAKTRKYRSKY